ncbi:acyltransferase family protein [Hyalangium gracile]|uniref:acyltransferase family protein n=1 Tax=Hyalangium gracile TaxID=394092 RepID=UPI001CCBB52F|nr:acyltransferase [Hyalangium gracile]
MRSASTGQRALPALTGLRFWAALHVVVFHFGGFWFDHAPRWLVSIYLCGYASVGLFFVLSGFVLAYNYVGPDGGMDVAPRAFWVARLARVYPVYVLALLLMAPQALFEARQGHEAWASQLVMSGVSSLMLVQAWLPSLATTWNTPGWSVAVEAFFYAVFPVAAVWVGRLRRERLGWTLAALWGLGLLPSFVYMVLEPDGGPGNLLTQGPWLAVLRYNPLLRLPEFLMGMVLGRLFLLEQREAGPRRSGALLATGAALLTLGAFAMSLRLPLPLLHNALLAPVYGALVYGLARGGGALGGWLSRPLLVRLGEASYAVYILQHPVWIGVTAGLGWLAVPMFDTAPRLFFVLTLSILVAVSLLSHRYVERPLRAWLRLGLQPWVEQGEHRPGMAPATPPRD